MKAIIVEQFGGAEQLQLQSVERPPLANDEVRVAMSAVGINPSDTYTLSGTYAVVPALPYTPGVDGAGTVMEVGSAVTHVRVGDRVFIGTFPNGRTTGTMAEEIVCEGRFVHSLPEQCSFESGAALGIPAVTAYRAVVQRANVQAGQTVFIHGASGGVGLMAVQMASLLGATVIGTASAGGKAQVKAAGAHVVLDHVTEEAVEAVCAQLDKQPDVIIECLANVNLQTDLQLIAPNGTIVVVGNRGTVEINPRLAMQKECAILGVMLWQATANQYAEAIEAIQHWLSTNKLQPIVGASYPLQEAQQAVQAVIDGGQGKVIITL